MDENNNTSILGYVSIVPKGAYSPTATYNRLNVVSYEGGSFMLISTTPITGVTPVDGPVWLQLCEKGEGVTVTSQDVSYATSDQGTTPPESGWQPTIPDVTAGNYLWTEIETTYSDGSEYSTYMVTRFGIDGTGAVSSVNGVSPDATGNVKLDIGSIATIDNTPTINSQNLVTSGGVYSRINAVLSSTQVKIASATISLPAGAWTGAGPYQQTVSIPTAGAKSQINIAAPYTAVAAAVAGGYSVVIANASGVFTAYAIGNKPSSNLSLPVTLIQLDGASGTIYGNPLNGAAGLTVDSISAGLGYNPGMVNPNLLDNWYFANPVNQRGQAEYNFATVAGGYTVDRWKARNASCKITLADDGLSIKNLSETNNLFLQQDFETPVPSQTVYSTLVENVIGTVYMQALFADSTFSSAVKLEDGLSSIVSSKSVKRCFMQVNVGASIKFKAAKLELGSVQTLARQVNGEWVLNEIPDYGEQLARCQRYFVRFDAVISNGFLTSSAKNYHMPIKTPVPMRAKPSVAMGSYTARNYNGYTARSGSTAVAPESLSVADSYSNVDTGNIEIVDTIATAVDTNNSIILYVINDLYLSADL